MVGFEAAEGSSGRCRLGDPVAATHAFELPLPHHLHGDSDLAVVGPLCRAVKRPNSMNETSEHLLCLSVSSECELSAGSPHRLTPHQGNVRCGSRTAAGRLPLLL